MFIVIGVIILDVPSIGCNLTSVSRTRGVAVVLQMVMNGSGGSFEEGDLCVVVLETLLDLSVEG